MSEISSSNNNNGGKQIYTNNNNTNSRKRKRNSITQKTNAISNKEEDEEGNGLSSSSAPNTTTTNATKVTVSVAKFTSRRLPEMNEFWTRHVTSSNLFCNANYTTTSSSSIKDCYTQSIRYLKSQGGSNTTSRQLRRRTRSYMPWTRSRFPSSFPTFYSQSRRARRRKAQQLQSLHRSWWHPTTNNNQNNNINSNWLETHLWHTKRFYMQQIVFEKNTPPWCLPLAHTGRGTQSIVKKMIHQSCCTIQDHTWFHQPLISLSEMMDNISTLQNFCNRIFGLSFLNIVHSGLFCTNVLFYKLDAYPQQCIGPGRIYCHSSKGLLQHVFLSVHPAIRRQVEATVDEWKTSHDTTIRSRDSESRNTPTSFLLTTPTALISIRGYNSTQVIANALNPVNDDNTIEPSSVKSNSWNQWFTNKELQPAHLSAVPITLQIQTLQNGDQKVLLVPTSEDMSTGLQTTTVSCWLLFVSPKPSATSVEANILSGWDILCPATYAKVLFMALEKQTNVFAIGIFEESALQLEAEYSQFPRDYPDTLEGQKYWSGTDTNWNTIRACQEQRQRINFPFQKKPTFMSIDWTTLLKADHEGIGSSDVVLVRGDAFGRPFCQVLHGMGLSVLDPTTPESSSRESRQRPRRKVRPLSKNAQAHPNTQQDQRIHLNVCNELLSSLSLPALLRCSLRACGKGNRMNPGDCIYEFKNTLRLLGYVTAGSFSPSRGYVHGIGMISAAHFLRAVSQASLASTALVDETNSGNSDTNTNNKRRIELRVLIENANNGKNINQCSAMREASLFILL